MNAPAGLPWTSAPTALLRKVIVGFALPVLILLIIGFFSFYSVQRFARAAESVAQTHELLAHLEGTLAALKDIDIGTRGFAVSGDNDYLKTCAAAHDSLKRRMQAISALIAGNGIQQKRLVALEPLIDQFFNIVQGTIATRKSGDTEKALVMVETGRGKIALDRIDMTIAQMRQEERRLLEQRQRTAEQTGFTTKGIIILAIVTALGVAILAGMSIHDDIAARKRAELEREALIQKLSEALATVKTLNGLLPICAWCKNIRDDKGYWKQLEEYIRDHSDAEFTHGICPACLEQQQASLGMPERSLKLV